MVTEHWLGGTRLDDLPNQVWSGKKVVRIRESTKTQEVELEDGTAFRTHDCDRLHCDVGVDGTALVDDTVRYPDPQTGGMVVLRIPKGKKMPRFGVEIPSGVSPREVIVFP